MLKPAPFQNRQGRFVRAYFENIKALLLQPKDYFKNYALMNDTGEAVLFAYLNNLFVCLIGVAVHGLVLALLVHFAKISGEFSVDDLPPELPLFIVENISSILALGAGVLYGLVVLIGPVLQILMMFLWAGVHHLFLLLVGGTRQDYLKTLQVYALFTFIFVVLTPLVLFMAVPFLGAVIGLVFGGVVLAYKIFFYVNGMSDVHGITPTRAFFSWFSMSFVCCCLMALPFILLIVFLPWFLTVTNH